MPENINEFMIPLGIEVDKDSAKQIDRFTGMLGDLAKKVTYLVAGITAAETAISAFVLAVSSGTEAIARSAAVLGESVNELDRWSAAAGLATGRTGAISAELQVLSRRASEAARGYGFAVQAFGLLSQGGFTGVWKDDGTIKNTRELLVEISDALVSIQDPARRIELAQRLGLQNLLPFLLKGKQGIEELLAEVDGLGVATEEDAKAAFELMRSWRLLKRMMLDMSRLIATTISPYLRQVIALITEWYTANRELLRQKWKPVLKSIGNMVYIFWRLLTRIFQTIDWLVTKTIGWANVWRTVLGLATAFVALFIGLAGATLITTIAALGKLMFGLVPAIMAANAAFFLLAAKVVIITGLLVFLALAIEDIYTSLTGGEGALAKFATETEYLKDVLALIVAPIVILEQTLKSVWEILNNPLSKDSWVRELSKIGDVTVGALGEPIGNLIGASEGGVIPTAAGTPLAMRYVAQKALAGGQTARAQGNTVTVNQGAVNLNFSGAVSSDPNKMREEFERILEEKNQQAIDTINSRIVK